MRELDWLFMDFTEHRGPQTRNQYLRQRLIDKHLEILHFSERAQRLEQLLDQSNTKISQLQKECRDKNLCKICFENQINTVLVPCGHAACKICFTKLLTKAKESLQQVNTNQLDISQVPEALRLAIAFKCPFCRRSVWTYGRLYI